MTLLTREEHYARAMLMGLLYDPRDGTYCQSIGGQFNTQAAYLDCITLEVIDHEVSRNRMKIYGPSRPYPWEKVDE